MTQPIEFQLVFAHGESEWYRVTWYCSGTDGVSIMMPIAIVQF